MLSARNTNSIMIQTSSTPTPPNHNARQIPWTPTSRVVSVVNSSPVGVLLSPEVKLMHMPNRSYAWLLDGMGVATGD